MLVFRRAPRVNFLKKKLTDLEVIVDRLSPKMRGAVLTAAKTARGRLKLKELSAALERGNISEAVRQVEGLTASDLAAASKTLLEARVSGATLAARALKDWSLNVANPKAIASAERQAALLVTLVSGEQRQIIRDLVTRAYREGVTAADTARLIRSSIGLDARRANALVSYRAGLVEDGIAAERIEALATRYGEKLLRDRADTIAQTEIHRASAEGQHELWREGVREGRINPATARRFWIANVGACDWCEQMESLNEDGVGVDDGFQTPDGDTISGPEESHVSCRCSTRIDLEGS